MDRAVMVAAAGVATLLPFAACDSGTPVPVTPIVVEAEIDPGDLGPVHAIAWSPDGRFLAHAGQGGLYVSGYPPQEPPKLVLGSPPRSFAWSTDATTLFFLRPGRVPAGQRRPVSEIGVYRTAADTTAVLREVSWMIYELVALDDRRVAAIWSFRGGREPLLLDDQGESTGWPAGRDLTWTTEEAIQALPRGAQQAIKAGVPGRTYGAPLTAPAGERFAIATQIEDAVYPVIVGFDSKIQHVLPLGFVSGQWSSDGRFLLGTAMTEDGHTYLTGEISLFDVETGTMHRLTDTPDRIEWSPRWCEATGKLAFLDYRTGELYVARLEWTRR